MIATSGLLPVAERPSESSFEAYQAAMLKQLGEKPKMTSQAHRY